MKDILEIIFDSTLFEIAKVKQITFAAVESFTGGAFAKEVTSRPGASKYFKGSLITYTNEIKEKLGVNTSKGVINFDAAQEMALKGKEYFDVDFCISFTGNAGPSKMDNKPVGLVYISINENSHELNLKKYMTRENIIRKAVELGITLLIQEMHNFKNKKNVK